MFDLDEKRTDEAIAALDDFRDWIEWERPNGGAIVNGAARLRARDRDAWQAFVDAVTTARWIAPKPFDAKYALACAAFAIAWLRLRVALRPERSAP